MQLLQQLQSRAENLEEAQALMTQQLKAQKEEQGGTLRRATLELAIAELHSRRPETSAHNALTFSQSCGQVVCLSVCLSVCSSVRPSGRPACLPVRPSVFHEVSACLPARLSV